MRRLALLLILSSVTLVADELRVAPSGTLEKAAVAKLTSHLDDLVEDGTVVGVGMVIARDNAIAYEHYAGLLDFELKSDMARDSLIRIYSMTKAMTAAAALIAIEDGRLALDTEVADYFPSWSNQLVYVADEAAPGGYRTEPVVEPVTVQHLLTHTAGISYGYYGATPTDRAYRDAGLIDDWDYLVHDTKVLVETMGPIPLLHQPGARWHYGFASDVLGQLVEQAVGQRLDTFLEERVFRPLGIEAYFDVPESEFARFGTDHIHAADGTVTVQDTPYRDPEFVDVTFISGGGGVVTTARGYLQFALMLANGGQLDGVRVLSEKSARAMTSNQLPADAGLRWGYGVTVAGDDGPLNRGSFGFGGAAGTAFWVDPVERLVGVVMVQRIGLANDVIPSIQALTYETLPK